jgi:hypothetical protein
MYYQRPSTPNLTKSTTNTIATNNSKLKSIFFDSRCMYPKLQDFMENENDNNSDNCKIDYNEDNNRSSSDHIHHDHNINSKHSLPDSARIIEAANALKAEFNLSLFGFDVIIPCNSNNNISNDSNSNDVKELVIIDVNFFPSYKEVINSLHEL